MTPKTAPQSPAELGQFTFRDGVWYLQATPPKQK